MKEFFKTHQVYLTPISPIHIGCGEDFEPTNYVIDNQILYYFNTANLDFRNLSGKSLLDILKNNDSEVINEKIKTFFIKNKSIIKKYSNYITAIENDVYYNKKFFIERNAYSPLRSQVYIPASGVKGCITTAFLDEEHQKRGSPKFKNIKNEDEKIKKLYLWNDIEYKLRYIKCSDFYSSTYAYSKIYETSNYDKQTSEDQNISLYREYIELGQYRTFQADLSIWENKITIERIFNCLQKYYISIFEHELFILKRNGWVSPQWVEEMQMLLELIKNSNNKLSLIRLGKTGADSKTFKNGVALIKIPQHKTVLPEPTCKWLIKDEKSNYFYPLGWAILEFDDISDNPILKNWCNKHFKASYSFEELKQLQNEYRQDKAKQQQLIKQQQEEYQAKQLAEQQAEQARLMALASMTENQRIIAEFVQKVKETRELQADNNGSILLKEAESLVKNAVENWSNLEKQYCFEQITIELLQTKVKFNKKDTAKNFNKLRNKLN